MNPDPEQPEPNEIESGETEFTIEDEASADYEPAVEVEAIGAPNPEPTDDSPESRGLGWLLALIAMALLVTGLTIWSGQNRERVRSSDEAAYAEQARSLLDDGTLTIGFVRHFHREYPADIYHTEDFYPPGPGVLIAGSWALVGESDFASAIPSMLIGGLLIPLLAFFLARRLGVSPPFAFGCAVALMFEPMMRSHAYQGLSDLPFTACVLAAAVAMLRPKPSDAGLAGAALGLGFWFKPTALLFGPPFFLALIVIHWSDRLSMRRRLIWLVAAGVLVSAPWMVRNTIEFGDPLYSGNRHVAASAATNPDHTYADLRKVYWVEGGDAAPDVSEAISSAALRHWIVLAITHVFQLLVDVAPMAFGVPFGIAALVLWRRRRVAALLVVTATYSLSLAIVFAPFPRYLMPVFPFVAVVAWALGDLLARALEGKSLPRLLSKPAWAALALSLVVAFPGSLQLARDVVRGRANHSALDDEGMWQSALWARGALPEDAVVMSQEALRFRHASGLRTVNTPFDSPEAIERVVEHHGVTHLVTTPSGEFSSLSNRFILPYLEQRGERWTREQHRGFAVWTRKTD